MRKLVGLKQKTALLGLIALLNALAWVGLIQFGIVSVEENGTVENMQLLLIMFSTLLFLVAAVLSRLPGDRAVYLGLMLLGVAGLIREAEGETFICAPAVASWFEDPIQVYLLSAVFLAIAVVLLASRRSIISAITRLFTSPASLPLFGAGILLIVSVAFDSPVMSIKWLEETLEVTGDMLLALFSLSCVLQAYFTAPEPSAKPPVLATSASSTHRHQHHP